MHVRLQIAKQHILEIISVTRVEREE
uniref:Uncharacterized protein n=1 Tax=Rhizophora mucronata TaxID=61149 RepID=A0A2P2R2P3_RHIMU